MKDAKTTRNSTLEKLRDSLDLVRGDGLGLVISAEEDVHIVAPVYDASPLIGMSRSQIETILGIPSTCDSLMFAPCQNKGDWFYSFYRLPKNSLGGGPELLLQFDKDNLCTYAGWVMTQ